MKFFQKNLWQLVGLILAIITIFATYNVFFLQRAEKGLQVIFSQPVSLVDVNPEAKTEIQVLYRNNPVLSLYLFQIEIENSGNQPIVESDFTREFILSFSDGYEIADVAITSSEPPNIGLSIEKISETEAKLTPSLLNPGDKVSIRFILLGNDSSDISENILKVDGRIVGIKEIKFVSSEKQNLPEWVVLIFGALFFAVADLFVEYALAPVIKKIINLKFKSSGTNKDTTG